MKLEPLNGLYDRDVCERGCILSMRQTACGRNGMIAWPEAVGTSANHQKVNFKIGGSIPIVTSLPGPETYAKTWPVGRSLDHSVRHFERVSALRIHVGGQGGGRASEGFG